MGVYDGIPLKQVRKDWKYLKEKYGEPYDFCGGWCNTEMLENILWGKAKVKDTIISLIEYYFTKFKTREIMDMSDEHTIEIIKRYYIE